LPYSGTFLGVSYHANIRHILDPGRSAITVELQLDSEGVVGPNMTKVKTDSRAAAFLEAAMVEKIMKSYLVMVGSQTKSSVFIAVPHHVQRQELLNRINLEKLMEQYPKIDIKVCFALFDESMLISELGYLYSVHRWVVALSRARCKTVLMMTPELRSPKLIGESGNNAKASSLESLDGWGLLQAFEKFATEHGGKLVWPLSEAFLSEIGMDAF
jgi:hypothetical protein